MQTTPDHVQVPLTNGGFALVSPEDAARVLEYRWYRTALGYAVRERGGRRSRGRETIWMHRFIVGAQPGQDVDHINHDRLDNRRPNLRACSRAQNLANARRHRDSTSPYKGVTFRKDTGRWTARIMVNGRVHQLGCFATAEDAAAAYAAAGLRLAGEFAFADAPSTSADRARAS